MRMLVVNIRKMCVLVRHCRMLVRMRMRLHSVPFKGMVMLVVCIVPVAVLME